MNALLQIWEAESFEKALEKGRTRPVILNCEHLNADGDVIGKAPFVVKAIGLPEVTNIGLYCEVIGNMVARKFGVCTPVPVLVNLSPEFCSSVKISLDPLGLQLQPGIAVGVQFIDGLAPIDPYADKTPQEFDDAKLIFAIDHILQNPDRHPHNHNCGVYAGRLIAYDFEMSLSFVYALADMCQPWELSKVAFERQHLFYDTLRGRRSRNYDWSDVETYALSFDLLWLSDLISALPKTWVSRPKKVFDHIKAVKDNHSELKLELITKLL